ncbi:hypothetical protein BS47DRAFT_1244977, partial [Hydnum rufescens UP504]
KRKITLFNLEGIDEDPYRGMTWVWENNTTNLVSEAFITTKDRLSGMATTELKPSSADTPVSEENKKEYVEAVIKNRISCHLAKVFDEYEPELLLSGMLHIDVEDWTKFTGHRGYGMNEQVTHWFWQAIRNWPITYKSWLLQLAT